MMRVVGSEHANPGPVDIDGHNNTSSTERFQDLFLHLAVTVTMKPAGRGLGRVGPAGEAAALHFHYFQHVSK
jgi:hypothetical protein